MAFFFPAEEGVDEKKWGERERSLALRALLLSAAARSRLLLTRPSEFVPRACAPPSYFFRSKTSFARETFLSAIVECVFSFSIG